MTSDERKRYDKSYYNKVKAPRRKAKANLVTPSPGEKMVLIAARMPESIVARCHRIKEEAVVTGRYPWRTTSEVYRGLIYKGLEAMKGDPLIDDALPYLQLVKHVEGMRHPRAEAEAVLHSSRQELVRLQQIGAMREAVQFYWTTVGIAQTMAPSIWRDWLMEQLEKGFPDLHKAKVSGVQVGRNRNGNGKDARL